MVLTFAVVLLGAYYALACADIRLSAIAPLVRMAAAYAAGGYRCTLTNRERALINPAFKHFVAPAIVEQMLDDPSKLKQGGEEYEVTVLFQRPGGFTSLAERLTPRSSPLI